MPLIVEGEKVPPNWAFESKTRGSKSVGDHLNIALINNMPDAALEDTELQFFALLDDASGHTPIFLKLYSLTEIPRTARGQVHINSFYSSLHELWLDKVDGVIITGTEPRQLNLRDESYWAILTSVFEWAEHNTSSAILSCLAAHAGVLYSDGIGRHRLAEKQFGIFEFTPDSSHSLVRGIPKQIRFPHSRWNEVPVDELKACGYTVLTQSAEGGVDTFVKKKGRSLFVHFQGHPEYGAETLGREYRRDIRRFLRGERETYPLMPHGYFDQQAAELLSRFQEVAIADRREDIMASFPESTVRGLFNTWHSTAISIYRNWLKYLMSRQANTSTLPHIVRADTRASADSKIV